MRLLIFNCLFLASVAVASPNERHKRDLAYLKNLITSAIFGRSPTYIQPAPVLQEENGYKLFQLPGYDDVMIKAAAKKPVVEEFVYPPTVGKVNLNGFGTVLGTKSKEDTLVAVKEVNNLLSTGILYGGQNNVMKETVVPMFPSLNTPNYIVEEKIKTAPVIKTRPVLTEVIETRPVLTEVVETRPVLTDVVETRPVLTNVVETRPVFTEVIRPVEEKVEPIVQFKPTYSYKQIQNNEPVIMYTDYNNPGVELVETIKAKTELPMCIKKRVDEAIVLGADLNRFAPVQDVFQYQSPLVLDLSYPKVEANLYVHNASREEITKESDAANGFGLTSQRLRESNNLRPTKPKANNPHPSPLHSHKPLHFEENISASKDKVNPPTKQVQAFNNLGEKDDVPHTLAEYIARVNNKRRNPKVSNGNMKQSRTVPIVGSKDNVSNTNIPVNVYKLQSNPNTGKVEKASDALRTNVKTNANQYDKGTAVNSGTAKKDAAQVKNVVYSNKETAKPQSITRAFEEASKNAPKQPLRENIQTSITHKPTVVKNNKNYSYPQKNADSSYLNVNGNKHGVSANVQENNNGGRGDIPDQ